MDDIEKLIKQEEKRQIETLMLIPSENYAGKKVRQAVGSVLSNKYSEGYPSKRYYQGNQYIDEIELLAIDKAKLLFDVAHVNVQAYSGSPANSAVQMALLNPGDTILGMSLSAGGHLTHGHPEITFSGKFFNSVQFGLNDKGKIDYDEVKRLALKAKPKLLMIGTTAYPFILDWEKFSEIARQVSAYFVADISHIAGLVASEVYPSPVPYAHVITTTTHKTLRGPRGAMIMTTQKGLDNDSEISQKIDKAVFPGLQGGPHNNTTAGIAQALIEADTKEFKEYGAKIIENAKELAIALMQNGVDLVGDGTESHLMLIDLRKIGLSGNVLAEALEVAGIIVNKNAVPNDTMPPFYPSGVRLGTPAVTTRGMGKPEMQKIAGYIKEVLEEVSEFRLPETKENRISFMKDFREKSVKSTRLLAIRQQVKFLTAKFPIEI